MASGTGRNLALFLAAALLGGAGAAQGIAPGAVAQYQSPPAQLPAPGPRTSAPKAPANAQVLPPADSDEACKRRWQDYVRSQECFAPYRTANGMRPEAYTACGKELLDPSGDCGPAPAR